MRRHLFGLLVVAALSGTVAGTVASAKAGKPAAVVAPRALQAIVGAPLACPMPARFRAAFAAASQDTGLPVEMLIAVATIESRLKPDAHSSAGARGLLQLLPATGSMLNLDIDEPASNILAGARYLRRLLDRFHSTELALAAYNAGPSAVAARGGAPTAATLTYIANVTALWRALTGCR